MKRELFVGLMTGTSVDAIDAVLCGFENKAISLVDAINAPLSDPLQNDILTLFVPGNNEIEQLGRLDRYLSEAYANAVHTLLNRNTLASHQIVAIGCHGQTVRHRPRREGQDTAFTLQIGDPNSLAVLTNIPVVADFRRKDVALGGEGAPLAPGFHHYLCHTKPKPLGVLNIGGIANLSIIKNEESETLGFDTGPGNALLDYWIAKNRGKKYDENGAWAAQGSVNQRLLTQLMTHPFFKMPPPKSTGKEEFSTQWLERELASFDANGMPAEDVQATLTELTALSVAEQLNPFCPLNTLYLCGGGAHNAYLIDRLRAQLPRLTIKSTEHLGLHPDWIEACAFAWLAKKRMDGATGSISRVTGATRNAILGGLWLP